jgi:hypothetical protein
MVYAIVCNIVRRKHHLRSTGHSILLLYTLGMLFVTIGWYSSAAVFNAKTLAKFHTVEQHIHESLADVHPSWAISRDIFKLLQTLGADAILVRTLLSMYLLNLRGQL